jgi:hypothetical protein
MVLFAHFVRLTRMEYTYSLVLNSTERGIFSVFIQFLLM